MHAYDGLPSLRGLTWPTDAPCLSLDFTCCLHPCLLLLCSCPFCMKKEITQGFPGDERDAALALLPTFGHSSQHSFRRCRTYLPCTCTLLHITLGQTESRPAFLAPSCKRIVLRHNCRDGILKPAPGPPCAPLLSVFLATA